MRTCLWSLMVVNALTIACVLATADENCSWQYDNPPPDCSGDEGLVCEGCAELTGGFCPEKGQVFSGLVPIPIKSTAIGGGLRILTANPTLCYQEYECTTFFSPVLQCDVYCIEPTDGEPHRCYQCVQGKEVVNEVMYFDYTLEGCEEIL